MVIAEVLSSVDEEIDRLKQVRALLLGGGSSVGHGRRGAFAAVKEPKARKKRTMSAEGRARIAEAQRKRWAKQKRAAK
jgi:hypothetical protein